MIGASATTAQPSCEMCIRDRILLDYSIYDAHRAGFDRVVFIIRPELHEAFEDAIGKKARRFMQVDYAYQTLDNLPDGLTAPEGREKPLGTAHAVWCAKELTAGCPIAVINADDFYGADRCVYETAGSLTQFVVVDRQGSYAAAVADALLACDNRNICRDNNVCNCLGAGSSGVIGRDTVSYTHLAFRQR